VNERSRQSRRSNNEDAEFFTVGQPLHAVRAGYIRRAADDELYDLLTSGQDAYLFAPLRSGKTSLIAATIARLQSSGYLVAHLDLAQVGERDAGSDAGRWYYSVAYRLLRQLRIKVDLQTWWQEKSILTTRQRLFEFYLEVLLANTKKPIVIIIDELQASVGLAFARYLIESITAVNKARATELEFGRLGFVLSGECDTRDVAPNPELAPFRMMRSVTLGGFSRESLQPFEAELNRDAQTAGRAMDRIHYWTGGQPYLMQKVARRLATERPIESVEEHVDRIVRQQFGARSAVRNEPHLAHIDRRIVGDRKNYEASLTTYGRLRKGLKVAYDADSRAQRMLIVTGLVVAQSNGTLVIANRIYELAFTTRWANDNLPFHWRGPAVAASLLILLTAIPFWYTQFLPKPYARMLSPDNPDIAAVEDTYRNLRSFPGHAATADRLFINYLESRAAAAESESELAAIAAVAAQAPGRPDLANQLVARYWDTRVRAALRVENRDAALLASFESLAAPTSTRRRIAASLLGSDYPQLLGSVVSTSAEQVAFDGVDRLLTMTRGAVINQWAAQAGRLEKQAEWTASALEVTPLLRRVSIEQGGTVESIGLTVQLSNAPPQDLRVRLVAPSGRAVEVPYAAEAGANDATMAVTRAQLAPLVGEALAGTWTLSLRNESPNADSRLLSWRLTLNAETVNESLEQPLDIPEPVERPADFLWLSQDGRYAVARTRRSGSVRLWNLVYRSPTQTLPVPVRERVLGLGGNAEQLLTVAQDRVHVWNVADGRRVATLNVGTHQSLRLLDDGQRIALRRGVDAATRFEIWDVGTASKSAELRIAGEPALASVSETGEFLAVADYDRAVRVWDIASAELTAQFDLPAQPDELRLAPNGRVLVVRYGGERFSLWRADSPSLPLVTRSARGEDWSFAFSASSDRVILGSARLGYQVFDTQSGRVLSPSLDAGYVPTGRAQLAFGVDENIVLSADPDGRARVWRLPAEAAGLSSQPVRNDARWQWRESADLVAALSPDAQHIAVGDAEGQVHIFGAASPPPADDVPLGYLGHSAAVSHLLFSDDGALVASVGRNGTIRIWDAESGVPRSFQAVLPTDQITRLRFSASGRHLAVLMGARIWMLNAESGELEVSQGLGEPHTDIAFSSDEALYLASVSGVLRRLAADRLGQWALADVWRGPVGLSRISIASSRNLMLLIDVNNRAQVFDIEAGTVGTNRLELVDDVGDVLFNARESQVLLRTGRWVHRADVSPSGARWRSAVRAPRSIAGSGMVFDTSVRRSSTTGREVREENKVLLLTRDSGYLQIAELDFAHRRGPLASGDRDELLEAWSDKLNSDFSER